MNRLSRASSPYLIQHQANPVDWWEWSDAAFAEAKRLDRPVLLSIGYAACHWCHVMAHESFEDEAVASVMNELFVCIKVDREERPDVDHIYMSALHALGEQGGWPLTMFLTPDREPFWGGTYFPKEPRYGKPGFADLLRHVAAIYAQEPERIQHNARALKGHLAEQAAQQSEEPTRAELLDAAQKAASVFDPVLGGIRGAPKFPNAPILNLLWRAGAHEPALRAPVIATLAQMALGGIHDHLGGGFARYSVDDRWLVPHFEKMLYDNAQLLELYALAAQETGDPLFIAASEGVVAWLTREMLVGANDFSGAESNPAGTSLPSSALTGALVGFAASLDADSEGEEGRFYVWSRSELESILGSDDAALFARLYDITANGNFEGRNIPNRLATPDANADELARLPMIRMRLLDHRRGRIPPGRDDKALADWNGLMIMALTRASLLLDRPDWLTLAQRAYRFVRESMIREGRLAHSWRGHVGVWPAFSLDHAAMALAALTLAEATGDQGMIADAKRDLDLLGAHYADRDSGLLAMNAADGDRLIVRPRPLHDDAVPNANGVYLEALVRYAAQAMDDDALARADRLIRSAAAPMRRIAMAHASLWSAFDLRLNAAQIVVVGKDASALRAAALSVPYPNRIVLSLGETTALPSDHVAAAQARVAGDGAAFVCRDGACSPPIRSAADVKAMFAISRH